MLFVNKPSKKIIFCLVAICWVTLAAYRQGIIAPGAKPALFAPGIVSTEAGEFALSFMPDGNTVYFSGGQDRIWFSKRANGNWAKPQIATFSGQWKDMDPFISPDGRRLFFSSYRPTDGASHGVPQKNAHIWYVDCLAGDNWSAPHHLNAPVNLPGVDNYAPSVSLSGALYFFSPRRDINQKGKSYYAKLSGNVYEEPKVLSLNGNNAVRDPFISPDESYLIFAGGGDLYISYHHGNEWSAGQKLSVQINNGGGNSSPYVSPDGKTLYYSANDVNGILMVPINLQ